MCSSRVDQCDGVENGCPHPGQEQCIKEPAGSGGIENGYSHPTAEGRPAWRVCGCVDVRTCVHCTRACGSRAVFGSGVVVWVGLCGCVLRGGREIYDNRGWEVHHPSHSESGAVTSPVNPGAQRQAATATEPTGRGMGGSRWWCWVGRGGAHLVRGAEGDSTSQETKEQRRRRARGGARASAATDWAPGAKGQDEKKSKRGGSKSKRKRSHRQGMAGGRAGGRRAGGRGAPGLRARGAREAAELKACVSRFGADFSPLSSCRIPQAALKFSYRSDRVTRY